FDPQLALGAVTQAWAGLLTGGELGAAACGDLGFVRDVLEADVAVVVHRAGVGGEFAGHGDAHINVRVVGDLAGGPALGRGLGRRGGDEILLVVFSAGANRGLEAFRVEQRAAVGGPGRGDGVLQRLGRRDGEDGGRAAV